MTTSPQPTDNPQAPNQDDYAITPIPVSAWHRGKRPDHWPHAAALPRIDRPHEPCQFCGKWRAPIWLAAPFGWGCRRCLPIRGR